MGLLGHYVKLTDGPRHSNKVQYMACYYKIFINLLLFQSKLFVSILFLLCVLANTCTLEGEGRGRGRGRGGGSARSSRSSGGEPVCLRPRATVTQDLVNNGTARGPRVVTQLRKVCSVITFLNTFRRDMS
jgi:hypothetical protein